jgi:hypothetical protein
MAKKKAAKKVTRRKTGSPALGRVRPAARFASMYPGVPPASAPQDNQIPPEVVEYVNKIESELKLPVWLLIQDKEEEPPTRRDSFNKIGDVLTIAFFSERHKELKKGQPIA